MMKICITVVLTSLFLVYSSFAISCEMKMGYRLNQRPPLITEYPENSGLYIDLYTQALKKINCKLTVIREPKNRLMHKLDIGEMDFYPGSTFTAERAAFLFFIKNGLSDSYLALSAPNSPPMDTMYELRDRILLVPKGGPQHNAQYYGAIIRTIEDLDIGQAISLLKKGKGDYFIYNGESILYFLKLNPEKIIMRPCCGNPRPMYLGFSKKSHHIKLLKNPSYIQEKPISIANYPDILDPSSNAKKFELALQSMIENGEVNTLYEKYY